MSQQFGNINLQQPQSGNDWFLDTGATSHVAGKTNILSKLYFPKAYCCWKWF